MTLNKAEKPQTLSNKNNYIIGGLTGFVEVSALHPFLTIKMNYQRNEPFSLNPMILYRGFFVNVLTSIPITSIQVGAYQWIQTTWCSKPSNLMQQMGAGFAAGVASSFLSCPAELIITRQQILAQNNHTASLANILRQEIKNVQTFFTGQTATALRDGGFGLFFLSVTPLLKKCITPYCQNENLASVSAGVISGSMATLITQPADTIKTIQQSNIYHRSGFFNTIKNFHADHGLSGFFRGTLWRSSSVIISITLMSWMKEQLEKYALDYEQGSHKADLNCRPKH